MKLFRENGSILVFEEDFISREDIENFWKGSLNKSQLQEIVNNRDLDFAVVVGDYRYRANGYYTTNGPSMVLRKIVSEIPQMEKLGSMLSLTITGGDLHKSMEMAAVS